MIRFLRGSIIIIMEQRSGIFFFPFQSVGMELKISSFYLPATLSSTLNHKTLVLYYYITTHSAVYGSLTLTHAGLSGRAGGIDFHISLQ